MKISKNTKILGNILKIESNGRNNIKNVNVKTLFPLKKW